MRLIDADELIVMEFSGIKFVPKEFIDDAPIIEPEHRWIPCSERMPESNDEVLVTYTVNGKKHRYVETATWYDGDEGYWSSPLDEYRAPGTKVEVIAWMPLPKPWGGEQDESDD